MEVVFYMGIRLEVPDGYYLKQHSLVAEGRTDAVALIRHKPHLYVAEIMPERSSDKFRAVFLTHNDHTKHVMFDPDLQVLLIKACAYDRLTSTTKG